MEKYNGHRTGSSRNGSVGKSQAGAPSPGSVVGKSQAGAGVLSKLEGSLRRGPFVAGGPTTQSDPLSKNKVRTPEEAFN